MRRPSRRGLDEREQVESRRGLEETRICARVASLNQRCEANMRLSKRQFLGWSTVAAAGAGLGFASLGRRQAQAGARVRLRSDPQGVLDLPDGFSYSVLQRAGDRMSDGRRMRPRPDGMAAFSAPNDQIILMRNHELGAPEGGVSRLVLDGERLEVLGSNDVLVGTAVNCAGGPSPWGWLSCEEVPDRGGVWICPVESDQLLTGRDRRRIDAYGSFRHEAVALDPRTHVAYLTEDEFDGALYRFVPTQPQHPFQGRLEAMTAKQPGFATQTMQLGDTVEVGWVEVPATGTRAAALAVGAAKVQRGEGIWWHEGEVFFTATVHGQVFRLVADARDSSRAQLTVVANGLRMPDNITVAPWGDLVVAEDNSAENYLRFIDRAGIVRDFARHPTNPRDEFAGVCFDASGRYLFVNIQHTGLTLAVSGPFEDFGRGRETS